MEDITNTDVAEFIKMGENAPTTKVLTDDEKNNVLNAIANAEIVEDTPKVDVPMVKGTDNCPHCENDFEYNVPENVHTFVCPNCGKVIPICDKCHDDHAKCDDCIYCDVSNIYNYLRGKATIERVLSNLNPSLTDMTTSSNPEIEFTYENFINDEGGDSVTWDIKYWSIYGMILNNSLTADSSEEDVLSFVKAVIKKNRE